VTALDQAEPGIGQLKLGVQKADGGAQAGPLLSLPAFFAALMFKSVRRLFRS
jgi:hypothetical protein